ncbi:MAG: hypothetical protein ACFFCS_12980 [Candidatus Hodarchaeota archaeon]
MRISGINFASKEHRESWIHHPVIGDPSWDAFEREPGNPIHVGHEPYEWTVNGFLFRDPVSQAWHSYIGLYPKGYWPSDGCIVYKETLDKGWELQGQAISGEEGLFKGYLDEPGGMPDVSIVHAGGKYHMVYDWANRDNTRGGLAYAWADKPEGPYNRANTPIHEDIHQEPLLGRYVRAYAGTLIQRAEDWMVICMMSTKGNAGGTWALACMVAPDPEGPYSPPTLLMYPQSEVFHPMLAEFFPAFVHDGHVYSPATSVALNRSFQVLFRAPIEDAHLPGGWKIHQHGSVWHDVPSNENEQGIWGQTFSGQVHGGKLRALFFSKTKDNVGNVHLANQPFPVQMKDGFTLSAAYGPSVAVLKHSFTDFQLDMNVRLTGSWGICWDCNNPLGPDRWTADATLHSLMRTNRTELRSHGDEWSLVSMTPDYSVNVITKGKVEWSDSREQKICIKKDESSVDVTVDSNQVWSGTMPFKSGRIELVAEPDAIVKVDEFLISGNINEESPRTWLPFEALAGAAVENRTWKKVKKDIFLHGFGFINSKPSAVAKWNFIGEGFRLYSPSGPKFGVLDLFLDGKKLATLDLKERHKQESKIIHAESNLNRGRHALTMKPRTGKIPLDCLEVI